jgi:radical SAM superfamily enzyme YgiQ (UPF0313 family)
VRPLADDELRWADAVMVSGMIVQAPSAREVLSRATALGKRTVMGGPAASTAPELFPEADHVFRGEAEGRLELLVRVLEGRLSPAPRLLSPGGDARPDVALSPVPRFDLVDLTRYATMALQVSRGCPFNCEFCDIIEMFGRVPRVKSAEQVLAELEALHAAGARGPLFLVDDNFIGNRRAVAKLLPRVAEWQRKHGFPFDLYTEASLDLAGETELVRLMVEAGFSAVFLGIETPSAEALRETHKNQNLRMPPARAVAVLTAAGLECFAGFILGFDADGPDIFDRQIEFISSLPIPRAMIGLLTALPGTQLWRRLEREGRLRETSAGEQFGRTNFTPVLDEERLVAGYRRVLATLYDPAAYYARCAKVLDQAPVHPGALRDGSIAALVRAVWGIGLVGPRRAHFWRLVRRGLRSGIPGLARAVTLAVLGEHLVRYTAEVVLPRLDGALADIRRQREAAEVAQVAEARESAAEVRASGVAGGGRSAAAGPLH